MCAVTSQEVAEWLHLQVAAYNSTLQAHPGSSFQGRPCSAVFLCGRAASDEAMTRRPEAFQPNDAVAAITGHARCR